LEDLRANEAEDIDVDVLVDCLQSGMDLLSNEEKEFFMQDAEEVDKMDESKSTDVTPHDYFRDYYWNAKHYIGGFKSVLENHDGG
jgi:hypothetical protein